MPTACLAAAFVLRLIFALPIDVLLALSIIFFEINVLSKTRIVAVVLRFLGRYSANMWLLHGTILGLLQMNVVAKFVLAAIITLLISFLLEYMKKTTGYNKLFAWAKDRISTVGQVK